MAIPAAAVGLMSLLCVGGLTDVPCMSTGLRYGVWLRQCPLSDLRMSAQLSADGLMRNEWGTATVAAEVLWVSDDSPDPYANRAPFTRGLAVDLSLLDAEGNKVPGLESRNPKRLAESLTSELKLPEVPDGDYVLRAIVASGFETRELLADLPLYAPAMVHVMSDRPLYKPGQEVLLRAAVLERADSSPVEARPGTWRVRDPFGQEMLVEKQPTADWGVASTTFPLDGAAQQGTWSVTYETGSDSDTIQFDVKPFKLPRFTVELEPSATWYTTDDAVEVVGTARYTSGAPVSAAAVEVNLIPQSGRWPIPLDWREPQQLRTDSEGRFRIRYSEVPADLMERAEVQVQARVTDETGETAGGVSGLVFSADGLAVSSVTELGDGLVESFNNRAYVRVTTPDGSPLRETRVVLSNPYDPSQPERETTTDADGVTALQLDPGKPVTIVDPPPPVRPQPLTPDEPSLASVVVHPGARSLDLAERRAFDRVLPAVARCRWHTVGNAEVPSDLRVDPSGVVRQVVSEDDPIGACVRGAMQGLRLPAGSWRTYDVTWTVPDSLDPHLALQKHKVAGSSSGSRAVERAAARARRCLPGSGTDGAVLYDVHWGARAGSVGITTDLEAHDTGGLSPSTLSCVRGAFSDLRLDEPSRNDGLGMTRVSLSVPRAPGTRSPGPTTRTGFAFTVRADVPEQPSTRLVFPQGQIPTVRLRPTPSLAKQGTTVEVEILRGPDFRGELPKKLRLMKGAKSIAKGRLDPDTRKVSFALPEDVEGFLHVEWGGARAVVFVKPDNALSVELSTDRPGYRPGETAVLSIQTRAGEAGAPAAVSLAGVDQTLSQLAPLLGPDDWGRVTVRASGTDAFDTFGPRALQLGQIRGPNAAQAAVLQVQNLPMDSAGDVPLSAWSTVAPETEEALTTAFYRALTALVPRVRAWEKAAAKGETLAPEDLSRMWTETLEAATAAGDPLVDGWGRPLTLRRLPRDLLVQTDPRQVVADSTRLPEDVTNWPQWVAENAK